MKTTIYNFSESSMNFSDAILTLLLALIMLIVIIYNLKRRKANVQENNKNKSLGLVIPFVGLIITLSISFWRLSPIEYFSKKNKLEKNDLTVVEGIVTELKTEEKKGYGYESFKIGTITFKYNDFDALPYGYNRTRKNKGIIQDGLRLKIYYCELRGLNCILKIEKLNP